MGEGREGGLPAGRTGGWRVSGKMEGIGDSSGWVKMTVEEEREG